MVHKSGKINWVRLSAAPEWTSGTAGDFDKIDLSSYVDPLHSKAFKIVSANIQIMPTGSYGLSIDASTTGQSIAMQIVTGAQTSIVTPRDGKVVYHKFGSYINDLDGSPQTWQQYDFKVTDLWPDGYYVVVDQLTCGVQATASFSTACRVAYTITGYQVTVNANQLASLLVAQTN